MYVGIHTPPKSDTPMPASKGETSYLENEPKPDIPIGCSGQDIKKIKWQIHAICGNILIMKHVHYLSTEKEGKNPKLCLNAYL